MQHKLNYPHSYFWNRYMCKSDLNGCQGYILARRHNAHSFSITYLLSLALVFKCNTCGLKFEEKKRLEIHKQMDGRKPKVTEYGSPEFSQDRLRG
jgi:hypothetical protein